MTVTVSIIGKQYEVKRTKDIIRGERVELLEYWPINKMTEKIGLIRSTSRYVYDYSHLDENRSE